MNKTEFERIYGSKVADAFFNQAEKIYMAASDKVDKYDFCEKFKTVGDNAEAIELMMDLAYQVKCWESRAKNNEALNKSYSTQLNACDGRRKELEAEVRKLERERDDLKAENAASLLALVVKGCCKEATDIFGRKKVIATKLTVGMELDAEEQGFVIEQFR